MPCLKTNLERNVSVVSLWLRNDQIIENREKDGCRVDIYLRFNFQFLFVIERPQIMIKYHIRATIPLVTSQCESRNTATGAVQLSNPKSLALIRPDLSSARRSLTLGRVLM